MRVLLLLLLLSLGGCAVADGEPPAAPLGLAMTANTTNSITLSWYRSPEEVTNYNVYASTAKDGTYERIATVTERTATHEKLKPGTKYFYKVSALNAAGESAQSTLADGFTVAPWESKPLPIHVAKNMCVTLGANVISDSKPISGKLANLVDGSDATTCRLRKASEIRIRLNAEPSIAD